MIYIGREKLDVSIHAPRAGRDGIFFPGCASSTGFQSTRPVRGATSHFSKLDQQFSLFQSTRPVRGATYFERACLESLGFQSTRPVRGATIPSEVAATGIKFQSTRPVRGATTDNFHLLLFHQVSIHAPRAGRDSAQYNSSEPLIRFNPRAPCGARPEEEVSEAVLPEVSIHAPRAGRDPAHRVALCACMVSIHAPRAGRDYSGQG